MPAAPRPLAAACAAALLTACTAAGRAAQAGTPPAALSAPALPGARPELAEILKASPPEAWRQLDPERLVVLDLPAGRVVIELAPALAPRAAAAVAARVREGWFDGLSVYRVQDGYVAQWGDADGDDPALARPVRSAPASVPPEFERPAAGLPFTRLPDGDLYAPEAGWSDGFPAGRDPAAGSAWGLHCYGAVGVARGAPPDGGTGGELYAVIGHAPRQLDRNITVVGRVVEGIERLAALPRGPPPMGFYEAPGQRIPIRTARLAADLPEAGRPRLEALRTEGPVFEAAVESRRNRGGPWYVRPAGRIDVCSVPLPVRQAPGEAAPAR